MKNSFITYLFLFFLGATQLSGYAQDFEEVYEINSEYEYSDFTQSDSYKGYLNSEQAVVPFDKEKWERMKRSVAEGMADDYYELQDSNSEALQDADNPYTQSRRSFKRYWREKNRHRAKRLPKKQKQQEEVDLPSMNIGKSPVLSNLLLVVVILGVAALVIFLFFNAPAKKNNKKISQGLGSVIPTEIPKTELELMLEKALSKKDYREAIRVYFIFIIRGLIVKRWINWEKEKTNYSYLIEMRDKPFNKEFESTVSVYEIVWYGKREITKEEYELLEPRFKNLTQKLDQ